jgi:anhydro-N-acetylmuramic acid kinase
MSGTSVDAIDAVLVELNQGSAQQLGSHTRPIKPAMREQIFAVSRGENDTVDALCRLDQELGEAFASATLALLSTCSVDASEITAIGSHGQTVRHRPHPATGPRYTLQIGDANVIAERTGICTVADFRRRDVAAGGEGAPLVPPFHADVFGRTGQRRAIVNIGGIANVTVLDGHRVVAGFDCGPGNTLLDAWVHRHRGDSFDAHGAWAGEHTADTALLSALMEDAYFHRAGPRSTGPEHFNLAWLEHRLPDDINPGDVQATLAELTVHAIVESLGEYDMPEALFVCGGGARNTDLMRRLHTRIQDAQIRLGTTDELGIDAEWVEASAFAWLARRTLDHLAGNEPVVTGASGARVLGSVYAGGG